jgi:4-hydroxybenzoate polyprenyltransferase
MLEILLINYLNLILIFLFSCVFFISYTFRYPFPALRTSPRKEVFGFIFVIIVLVSALIFSQVSFTKYQVIMMISYGIIFYGYSIYSFLKYKNDRNLLVRNQIVWPTVLSIGLSLYYGLSFKLLSEFYEPLIPIFIFASYFIISEKWLVKRRYFIISNLVIIMVIILSPFYTFFSPQLINSFLALLFCIITSAYLAVFETWRITFHIHKLFKIENSTKKLYLTNKYYIATLMALSISILIYPYAFVFNIYKTLFLIIFIIHAIISLWVWFRVDTKSELEKHRNWAKIKIWYGSTFIAILIFDSIISIHLPKFETSSDIDSVKILGLYLSAAAIYPMSKLWQGAKKYRKQYIKLSWPQFLIKLYSRRMSFVRSFAVLAVVLGLITLLIRTFTPDNKELQNKTYYAIIVYGIMVGLSMLFELVDEWPTKKKKMTPLLTGIGATTRIFSSILIGTIVLLPLLNNPNTEGNFLIMGLVLTLIAMGGFALNDFFDSSKDVIDKSHRAIPSGILSEKNTFILAFCLFILSFGILIFTFTSIFQIFFTLAIIIGVIGYNLVVRFAAIVKPFYCAFLCCTPLIYVYHYSEFQLTWIILPVSAFFFISGRELLMDIHDINGDLLAKTKTLPILIGKKRTQKLAFSFLFLGSILFFTSTFFSLSLLRILIYSLIIFILVFSYFRWDNTKQEVQRRLTLYLWLPLLLGIISLAIK